jgi:hypothetical protein
MFPRAVREVAVGLDEKLKAGFDLVDETHYRAGREELVVGDVKFQRVEPLRIVFQAVLRLESWREEGTVPVLVIETRRADSDHGKLRDSLHYTVPLMSSGKVPKIEGQQYNVVASSRKGRGWVIRCNLNPAVVPEKRDFL